ncbi:MAG: hypothetical protein IJ180_03040 [Bacteroidales bacterium]|nr:hypothetical protein [Bacteroidales bacterium]
MKKVLLVIFSAVLLLSNANLQAQNNEHLKFMGISMDMNVNSFVAKLKQKGLKYDKKMDETIILNGKFAGNDNCNIYVFPNSENKVKNCGVFLDYRDDWRYLYADYITIKDMLIKKYGEPIKETEEWDGYEPSTDYGKMSAVRNGKCRYFTLFDIKGNIIAVSISGVLDLYGGVNLNYIDKINYNLDNKSNIEDL